MPAELPGQATEHMPDHALRAVLRGGGVESYATVDFVGRETNPYAIGPIVEVDENSWIEANFWHFEEVSETRWQVELFDQSRGVALTIDYKTDEIYIYAPNGELALIYDITGVDYSPAPVIPDGWIL